MAVDFMVSLCLVSGMMAVSVQYGSAQGSIEAFIPLRLAF